MRDERQANPVSIGAAVLFMAIFVVVFIAFEPTRDLLCARYSGEGSSAGVSCWRNFLYDYQTLVTGVLAVLAASVTVGVMIGTDQRAQQRHEQLVRLQMRSDKLIIEKGILPHIRKLRRGIAIILDAQSVFAGVDDSSIDSLRERTRTSVELNAANQAVMRLNDVLRDEDWKKAELLFDGKLSLKRQLFFNALLVFKMSLTAALATRTDPTSENISFRYRGGQPHMVTAEDVLSDLRREDELAFALPERLGQLALFGESFIAELGKLAELYEIDLDMVDHLTPSPDQS